MPAATVIIPAFNDEAWVERAIMSCLAQSRSDIEVICIDDASTDTTCAIVEAIAASDSRVRLIKQQVNQSAFQARKLGVEAASSQFVMFLDGDDELHPRAVEIALDRAETTAADVVGFGVEVRSDDGIAAPRFERSLQPLRATLEGDGIIPSLFPPDLTAQGHLWRYLWRTDLLAQAYAGVSSEARFYRANDIPITFLALMAAKKYVSTSERLYLYYFRRGTSGHGVSDLEQFAFYLSAVDSINFVADRVYEQAAERPMLAVSYESARRSIVGNILGYVVSNTSGDLQDRCIEMLRDRVQNDIELLRAAAVFRPDAVDLLATHVLETPVLERPAKNVLLTTGKLGTGGVQGVLVAQAHLLVKAGFNVTVATFGPPRSVYEVPADVEIVQVSGRTDSDRIASWSDLIRARDIDVIIDHHVLYNTRWPLLVLVARSMGVRTIGWLHNFALRAMVDATDRISFLRRHLPYLETAVVLSYPDVTFWKTQGVNNVVYLPNPLLQSISTQGAVPKALEEGSRLELAWWGRLQQTTKQVRDLIEIARRLDGLGVDFHLTVIGPDSADLTARQLRREAQRLGVAHRLTLTGSLQGEALVQRIRAAHVFVSTSVIEGYPLTLVEAQAHGLPVVMYELPWLAMADANDGLVAVPQGDKQAVAEALKTIAYSPAGYSVLSRGSIEAASRALHYDFASLYQQLIDGELPVTFSPEPSIVDAALLLRWSVFYAERTARIARRDSERAERRLARVRRELKQIETGWSFRVGRVLTRIPRMVRGMRRGGSISGRIEESPRASS
ncbi:glycosyltransferase [Microbacterium caowuchunii]|uniref:glycosyltransferase n=1 Tax=Microbacterium caowuchunii TaxID=2614638 RepID=UPI001248690D|nr:glycosyltransferase [Microbacterium caowuchunii]QEV99028.1 glycosyltransferase [Microbacterium caowuchunii]